MTLWTVQQYLDKLKPELDLQSEDFVDDTELMGYVNEAVQRAEQLVLGIHEDYFLDWTNLSITQDSSVVTLPADIYAHKIRRIHYQSGLNKYEIKRLKDLAHIQDIEPNEDYRYIIRNSLASGAVINLFPASRETSSSVVTCYYLRNARTCTAFTDYVDIPEASNFISAYVALRVWIKEGHPNMDIGSAALAKEEQELVTTLNAMVPDEDNRIVPDLSYFDVEI